MQALDPVEQEQIEGLRSFWQKWRTTILASVATFVLSFGGFQFWEYHKRDRAEASAGVFEQFEAQLIAQNLDGAQKLLLRLQAEFDDSPYSAIASMYLAKAFLAKDQDDTAKPLEWLNWAVVHAQSDWVRDWARVQWAQILIHKKEYDKIVSLTQTIESEAAKPLMFELCGDAQVLMGKINDAKESYQKALAAEQSEKNRMLAQSANKNPPTNPMLKIKLQSLGVVVH